MNPILRISYPKYATTFTSSDQLCHGLPVELNFHAHNRTFVKNTTKNAKRRFLLDTNIWSYVAAQDAAVVLIQAATSTSAEILVAPTVIEEIRRIPDTVLRQKTLRIATQAAWIRLMPEAYSECSEIKAEIKRLRPEWAVRDPQFSEQFRLRYDWVRRSGGYWDRARRDTYVPITDESIRSESELQLARDEAQRIRTSVLESGKNGAGTDLRYVGYLPDAGTPGWSGNPIEYWRAPSLFSFRKEFMIYASPYREL